MLTATVHNITDEQRQMDYIIMPIADHMHAAVRSDQLIKTIINGKHKLPIATKITITALKC